MALPRYFIIKGREIGGTKEGTLQYLSAPDVWTDLGEWLADVTSIRVDPQINPIEVDYNIFTPGETYFFRFIDAAGRPIGNIVTFTFPEGDVPLLNVDDEGLLGPDDGELFNVLEN